MATKQISQTIPKLKLTRIIVSLALGGNMRGKKQATSEIAKDRMSCFLIGFTDAYTVG
jgi:hypothetical protein